LELNVLIFILRVNVDVSIAFEVRLLNNSNVIFTDDLAKKATIKRYGRSKNAVVW
jgi:hypothetical protein